MTGRNNFGEALSPPGLVRQLLAASGAPEQWRVFLEELRQAMDASSVQMLFVDTLNGRPNRLVHACSRTGKKQAPQPCWSRGNPLTLSFVASPAGTLATCEHPGPDRRGLSCCPDANRHPHMHYWLFGCLFVQESLQVQLWCHRAREQGPFSQRDPSWLEEILGLTGAALAAQRQWIHRSSVLECAVHAGQRGLLPFLLCDPEGRIHYRCPGLYRNSLAALGARISGDRLVFRSAALRRNFEATLADALDAPRPETTPLVPSGAKAGASGHEFWVMPLKPGTGKADSPWPDTRLVTLYVHDRDHDIHVDPEPVARLLGLSPAEARVAAELARGCAPETIARNHGHSLHTVRKQLKSVFRKTGVNRQADLASLILRSPAAGPVSGGD